MDPELAGDVLTVIKELADDGRTMVVVTHERAFVRQVADEVIVRDGGAVVERGHQDTVLRDPREERTRQFVDRLLNPAQAVRVYSKQTNPSNGRTDDVPATRNQHPRPDP